MKKLNQVVICSIVSIFAQFGHRSSFVSIVFYDRRIVGQVCERGKGCGTGAWLVTSTGGVCTSVHLYIPRQ